MIGKEQKHRIFKRDKYRCLVCKTRKHLTIDHILPKSCGGDDSDDNLQTLCSYHNHEKGCSSVVDYRNRKGLPRINPYIGSIKMKIKLLQTVVIHGGKRPEKKECLRIIKHASEAKRITTKPKIFHFQVRGVSDQTKENPYFTDLTGCKIGDFIVLGLDKKRKGRWVVQCKCGNHEVRTKKALLNTKNANDKCRNCRKTHGI